MMALYTLRSFHSIFASLSQTTIMKIGKLLSLLCLVLVLSSVVEAQASTDGMIKEWERAKAYTKEYLDAMPEAGYALKPTPEMRSFAEQMLHLTDALYAFASTATGEKSPVGLGESEKSTDKSKANVTNLVMAGYDYMISSIKKLTPVQMNEHIKMFGRFEMTKGMAIEKCFEHQTHHRGQTTVYIRLAGARPPQEKLF